MKVSIITVCYNSAATIKDTIDSVVAQNYQDIEYIIIDGKSTDRTIEIINSYSSKVLKCFSEPDNGLYDAINKGIKVATGEIVGLVHADDVLASKDVISKVVDVYIFGNFKLIRTAAIENREVKVIIIIFLSQKVFKRSLISISSSGCSKSFESKLFFFIVDIIHFIYIKLLVL